MELTELKNKIIESFSGSASDLEEVLQMVVSGNAKNRIADRQSRNI